MKLTGIVLLGLIGVAIALHGTGAYGNGGYGNNGGGHKHHKSSESESSSSSESEEAIPPRPKTCALKCRSDAKVEYFDNGVKSAEPFDCASTGVTATADACKLCCEAWFLSRGLTIIEAISVHDPRIVGAPKCNCCERRCT
uniref:Uncharacterized protein n=1 Tax=Panagrolaimus davidi TaxID=227884 RepID=A0A914QH09_9BILA